VKPGFYKFVKVQGEFRLTTCKAGMADVPHRNLVQPGEKVEAAGAFISWHRKMQMLGRSEGLNVGYGPEHAAELSELLGLPLDAIAATTRAG